MSERERNTLNHSGEASRISTSPPTLPPESDSTASVGDNGNNDDIPYEDRLDFAGVDPDDDDELVTTEELIASPSSAKPRGAEQSPLPRTALVAGSLGILAFLIWALSGLFGGGEQTAQESEQDSPVLPTETTSPYDESDQYKAELALIEQDKNQPRSRIAPDPQSAEPASQNAEQAAGDGAAQDEGLEPSPPATVRSTPTQPTPAPAQPTPPAPTRTSPTPAAAAPNPEPEADVDPMERWAQLASAGSAGSEVAMAPQQQQQDAETGSQASSPSASADNPTRQQPADNNPNRPFPADTIGDDPVPPPEAPVSGDRPQSKAALVASTPGAQGILQQQPVNTSDAFADSESSSVHQVALGSSAAGQVIVPMVYAADNRSASRGKFAVKLTAPLEGIHGNVALPAGTVLITQTTAVLEANIVRQQVVAIVYEDASGAVRQEVVEPGVLLVRGPDNRPLVAQVQNGGGDSFGDDLLVGALSALGNIGSVVNAPESVTTAASEAAGGTTSTRTTTTVTGGGDDNVLAAALEGFFTPVAERVSERTSADAPSTTPYLLVPEGQAVSIYVNGFLEVVR
jgi:hypothetical protein